MKQVYDAMYRMLVEHQVEILRSHLEFRQNPLVDLVNMYYPVVILYLVSGISM